MSATGFIPNTIPNSTGQARTACSIGRSDGGPPRRTARPAGAAMPARTQAGTAGGEPAQPPAVIRVLLVEPMSLLRTALATVLSAEADMEVVAQLATVDDLAMVAPAKRPNVAVVDIDRLTAEQAGALITLDSALPGCAVLALARRDASGPSRRALSFGMAALVDKDTAPHQLAQYIRRVARGERVVDPRLAAAAMSASRNPLTPRERDVLRAAAAGLPSPEIAASLRLSAGTVRNYLSAIIRKTGARNRLEAVRFAEKAGWL